MKKYASVFVPVPLRNAFTYSFDPELMDVKQGFRVKVPFGKRNARGYVTEIFDTIPEEAKNYLIKDIAKIEDKEPLFSKNEIDLAIWMEEFYSTYRGIALDTMIPGGKRDVVVGALDTDMAESRPDVELSDEQRLAVDRVINGTEKLYYLFGVTGSGKTEVFLNCAEKIIQQGGQVIYLVPEITLTHQLALQVAKRFKDNVAILHSGLTEAQRATQWRKIKRGEVGLIIGARSAVFAPCENLKLIIVDEEHENSYKSGNDPRYHARQVAQRRIKISGGKLLMGSATPSLEAWKMMNDPSSGMVRLNLTKRLGGGKLPLVTVADMTKEKGIFSQVLQNKMHETLGIGKQVILFLNRRGFSYSFHCRKCGYELKCPHCDVALTYHKKTNSLVCHYCGHTEKPRSNCPECGSVDVLYNGFGTEQVEAEIKKLFPMYTCARLDTDTVSKDRSYIEKTLDSFKKGEIQILLGTQMVAKGLNFPNVKLVGIVMPDNGLMVPDFRAEERTFDLIVQVSGRSGRSDSNGEVVIQTRMKENSSIMYAENARVEDFLNRELKVREETDFPPYSRLVSIVTRSKNQITACKCSENIKKILEDSKSGCKIFPSQECPIEKVRTYYRYRVVFKSESSGKISKALEYFKNNFNIPYGVAVEIDRDPLEML